MLHDKHDHKKKNNNPGHDSRGENTPTTLHFQPIYELLDVVVDTFNLSHRKSRAVKYGFRAMGEILAEVMEASHTAKAAKHTRNGKTKIKGNSKEETEEKEN